MENRNILFTTLLVCLPLFSLTAQDSNGLIGKQHKSIKLIILSLGSEYCFADTKESPFEQSFLKNKDISLGYQVNLSKRFGYRASASYTTFSGSDGASKSRSYSFYSTTWQMATVAQYTISAPPKTDSPISTSIYFFIGAGILSCRPDLNYYSKKDYKYKAKGDPNFSVIIPAGFGYQRNLSKTLSIGMELNVRWNFSDYLDGFKPPVSQSKSPDIIQGFSIVLGYKLHSKEVEAKKEEVQ